MRPGSPTSSSTSPACFATIPISSSRTPVRVYLDLDPVFNQLWHEHGVDVGLARHTHFVTVGRRVAAPGSTLPSAGRSWLARCSPSFSTTGRWLIGSSRGLTTVANWRGYGSIEHDGVRYGQKAHSCAPLLELPRGRAFRVYAGLAIHPDERGSRALVENGLATARPAAGRRNPGALRAFVRGSKAELGIAKEGYVVSRSGWFSDRSVCYLASGRPVVAQDTGFGAFLPVGEGLIPFETIDDAVAGVEDLRRDYERHRRAARALAEDVFDSDKVLAGLLSGIGVA